MLPVDAPPPVVVGSANPDMTGSYPADKIETPLIAGIDPRCWIAGGAETPVWVDPVPTPDYLMMFGAVTGQYVNSPLRVDDSGATVVVRTTACFDADCLEISGVDIYSIFTTTDDVVAQVTMAITAHVSAPDPHTQYALEAALGGAAYTDPGDYDPAGAASAAVAAHAAASNPHPSYELASHATATYVPLSAVATTPLVLVGGPGGVPSSVPPQVAAGDHLLRSTAPGAAPSWVSAVGLYETAGAATSAVAAHVALPDPHTQYALESALGTAAYQPTSAFDAAGAASAAVTAHVALSDPHTQYALESALGSAASQPTSAFDAAGAASSAVAAHEAASDPHPDYLTQDEADALYAQSPLVAGDFPGGQWPSGVRGDSGQLGSVHSITSANGTYEALGLSLTLTANQTVEFKMTVAAQTQVSSGAGWIQFKLRNTTDSTDVSDIFVVAIITVTGTRRDETITMPVQVRTPGHTATYDIYVCSMNTTGWTTRAVNTANSRLQYIRLEPT